MGRRRRAGAVRRVAALALASALAAAVAGCDGGLDGGGDDGGIIGTGVQLRGTVPTGRTLARAEVEIRAASGERVAAPVGPDGRFAAEELPGRGPWLLRARLGNGEAYHAIAYPDGAGGPGGSIGNVHAYTDLALRSWFATRGRSVDEAFEGAGEAVLPDASSLAPVASRIDALIAGSLEAWGLGGVDLGSVPFASNDAGVDRFLDRNPVLIDAGTVTVVVTDPVDATQARPVESLPLATDLAAPDTAPPTAPTVLRALPSAVDEIVLAWEGAADDVGVAAYEVLRDGAAVARTPYPVYLDSPLAPGAAHVYAIVAIDASGNRSAPSSAATARPLAAPDTTAPPTPLSLRLVPGLDSVALEWAQTDIGDVALFAIERGPSPDRLELRARVSSTFALDAGLDAGTRHCYRVSAIDASANASAPTPVACTTTLGEGVTTVVDAAAPGFAGSATLGAVDVDALACATPVPTVLVDAELTLAGGCFRVTSTLRVATGGRLTVAPGTVLKFASGGGIRVEEGGAIVAVGTAAAPIVMSGVVAAPGAWNGVELRFSDEGDNRFEHVVIERAGAGGSAALRTDTRPALPVRLAADNLLLRDNAGAGFAFARDTTLGRFSRVRAVGNASAGALAPVTAAALAPDSGFAGNAVEGVRLLAQNVQVPLALPRIDVPWLVERLVLESSLALPAGTRMRVDAGGSIHVLQTGSLAAVGTPSAPIEIEGAEPVAGHWQGISWVYSASEANRLELTRLAHGGSTGAPSGGNLRLQCRAGAPTRLRIRGGRIADSGAWGIHRDDPDRCALDVGPDVAFEGNALGDLNPEETP